MNHKLSIGVIILAAGSSSRMGQPKQLLKIQNKTLIERTIEIIQSLNFEENVLVLGANADKILAELDFDKQINVVLNKEWEKGMGTSLKTGVNHLLTLKPDLDAILIGVCDQPYLNTSILKKLIKAFKKSGNKIAAASYGETMGVPAIFGKEYFPALNNLNADEGARKLLKMYKGEVTLIDFPKGEIDLDTPEDYQKALKDLEK